MRTCNHTVLYNRRGTKNIWKWINILQYNEKNKLPGFATVNHNRTGQVKITSLIKTFKKPIWLDEQKLICVLPQSTRKSRKLRNRTINDRRRIAATCLIGNSWSNARVHPLIFINKQIFSQTLFLSLSLSLVSEHMRRAARVFAQDSNRSCVTCANLTPTTASRATAEATAAAKKP